LESVCLSELGQIGIQNLKAVPGGVRFFGDLRTIYSVNLRSRVGIRLFLKITDFDCHTKNDLQNAVTQVNWKQYMNVNQSFLITAFVDRTHLELRSSQYTALVAKDGIADRFRKDTGLRPSVDKDHPDIHILIHIHHNRGTIYLDSTGIPLSKRGYRRGVIHKASLNESLAAGILALTKWDGTTPFYDPMCGSGTFAVEAAMIAARYSPGLTRNEFGFMKWKDFDMTTWLSLKKDAMKAIRVDKSTVIYGSDIREEVLYLARQNAQALKEVTSMIRWENRSVVDFKPHSETGVIVMNPPYGIRTGVHENLLELYSGIGDTLKQHCQGHIAFIFTGNPDLAKNIGLKPFCKIALRNGNIECKLFGYELYSGSRKQKYQNEAQ